jgi:hypothetical protein
MPDEPPHAAGESRRDSLGQGSAGRIEDGAGVGAARDQSKESLHLLDLDAAMPPRESVELSNLPSHDIAQAEASGEAALGVLVRQQIARRVLASDRLEQRQRELGVDRLGVRAHKVTCLMRSTGGPGRRAR